MDYFLKLWRFIYGDFIPVTKTIVVTTISVNLAGMILTRLGPVNIIDLLALNPVKFLTNPWSLLTYPLMMVNDLFSLIFSILWLWFIGGSLERGWGSKPYGSFFAFNVLGVGLLMVIIGAITGADVTIAGLWVPLVGLTWAWAEYYPSREILFWGVIPIKAEWLAWIQAALTFFTYLGSGISLAAASLSGLAVYYFFYNKRQFATGRKKRRYKH